MDPVTVARDRTVPHEFAPQWTLRRRNSSHWRAGTKWTRVGRRENSRTISGKTGAVLLHRNTNPHKTPSITSTEQPQRWEIILPHLGEQPHDLRRDSKFSSLPLLLSLTSFNPLCKMQQSQMAPILQSPDPSPVLAFPQSCLPAVIKKSRPVNYTGQIIHSFSRDPHI